MLSESQYERQLKIWGVRKSRRRTDWCRIIRHLDGLVGQGKDSVVIVDGIEQLKEKISREVARNKYRS
jgi:hypothetical protein